MNLRAVLYIIAILIVFEGLSLLLPILCSLYYGDGDAWAILLSSVICLISGGLLALVTRNQSELKLREGFAIVVFGWTALAFFGALPFVMSGAIPSYTDAFFETMSGFSTTGATILRDIEALPHGLLFWRSMTHWLGGMGIVVLSLAILPLLGVGGMQLYKAEVPGPTKDRLSPRIAETAKILWGVYLLLSVVETVLLMFGGMSLFDALCHTFGTMATGGFSTKNASIAHYNSLYLELVIMLFMFLAGTNFSLHYRFLRGKRDAYHMDREFRFYLIFTLVCIMVVTFIVFFSRSSGIGASLRSAAFQVVSIMTTTGFGSDDFELWNPAGQLIMVFLMFIGGCAGSTGGSIKIIRIMLVLKHGVTEVKKLLHPNAFIPVRLGGRVVPPDVVTNILAFLIIYMLIFIAGSVCMALLGLDSISACSSVAAT
ncbi:MAG TPA: potassium transporter TrkG, partial [bacterium]|nr:potassium transporter TrkG [bacterium]